MLVTSPVNGMRLAGGLYIVPALNRDARHNRGGDNPLR